MVRSLAATVALGYVAAASAFMSVGERCLCLPSQRLLCLQHAPASRLLAVNARTRSSYNALCSSAWRDGGCVRIAGERSEGGNAWTWQWTGTLIATDLLSADGIGVLAMLVFGRSWRVKERHGGHSACLYLARWATSQDTLCVHAGARAA